MLFLKLFDWEKQQNVLFFKRQLKYFQFDFPENH